MNCWTTYDLEDEGLHLFIGMFPSGCQSESEDSYNDVVHPKPELTVGVVKKQLYVYTLAGQKLCFLSLRTANPFPLESFRQHESGQFSPGKSFLVY